MHTRQILSILSSLTGSMGRTTVSPSPSFWAPTWPNWVQLGRRVFHVAPSCPIWLLLGSNLVHLASVLVQLSANLAQLGPILAQLGSNFVQFWSQLGPTWSQNLTKMNFKRCFLASTSDLQFSIDFISHVGSIFQGFWKAGMSQNYKKPIVFLGF